MGERRAVRLVFFFSKTRVVRRSAHTTRKWEVPSRKLQPTKTKLRLGWSNVLIISKVKKRNDMTWPRSSQGVNKRLEFLEWEFCDISI